MAEVKTAETIFNHDKLSSTINNSMAISSQGDVYVWGKTN